MKAYVEKQPIGQWLLSVTGIGEVISAGLIANLDIRKAKTAGAFWRFCGLDPTVEWLGTARAEKLIDAAAEAGADAVKFQTVIKTGSD